MGLSQKPTDRHTAAPAGPDLRPSQAPGGGSPAAQGRAGRELEQEVVRELLGWKEPEWLAQPLTVLFPSKVPKAGLSALALGNARTAGHADDTDCLLRGQ